MVEAAWWAADASDLVRQLDTGAGGLDPAEAAQRSAGKPQRARAGSAWRLLLAQFASPPGRPEREAPALVD